MPRNSNSKWTEDEDRTLLKMKAAGRSSFSIAAALKRSVSSVAARVYILKMRSVQMTERTGGPNADIENREDP